MASKKRLIDANALIYEHCDGCSAKEQGCRPFYDPMCGAVELIHDAPTIDAVEVVRGRWIMDKLEIGNPYDGNGTMLVDIGNCSACGYRCEMLPIMNYCPNCGAKMDGGAEDGK